MVNEHLNEAIESLSLLRMHVLRRDPKNNELRASFREISHHLENIERQKPVPFNEFQRIAGWLAMFLEADAGAEIRRYNALNEAEREALNEHIGARRRMMLQAEQSVPQLEDAVGKCLSALNCASRHPGELDKQARELARALKHHMQDDEKLRKALNELIAALQKSLEDIAAMLAEVGEDSPELDAARDLLEQDLPDDPKAAKEVLLRARESILATGKRISQAGQGIRNMMAEHQSQLQELSKSLNAAEFAARHDALTGLGNRRMLASFIQNLGDRPAAFLLLDIDHFKRVNDRYGHDAGDEILVMVGQTLASGVRASDLVIRLGGEEFAVVLPGVGAEDAFEIAEGLRQAIGVASVKYRGRKIEVTASIGMALRKHGESPAHWMQQADQALYEAKNNGRNRTIPAL